ncbi:UDP-N-acetylmuramoyl-L-alanine--D-glutamate ligase [Methyloradius palustris]|uniref:UDP-N-acetylmuramoylalanine--D-glutamate ligase n=1 Tax=Methyloradius palustris TaxID=2778876 RepID=A0A8D5GED8_9PROT|nr:UDP-N-acetylmuramoyl-L-alanine--D-glutamate ligase [Methyloradius palustris]BCM25893.1 UDP-N-acetylmuramoylalanine--D-glutamate ligase [Methyloradius palustris]
MMLSLENKQVLVLGLGDTGLSALRWLKSRGAVLSVADSREVLPSVHKLQAEMPEVSITLGAFKPETFANAELIVISPGVALAEPEVQAAIARGVKVVGDVELFAQYRNPSAKVIAITGSNGKTTVTTLVGEMCKAAGLKTVVAGNIGLPVLDALFQAEQAGDTPDVYVLELSSFQLETTNSLIADAATVLNISEDHMDRYESLHDYAAAKARIFEHANLQVLNRQDVWSDGMALPELDQITFGADVPKVTTDYGLLSKDGKLSLAFGQQALMPVSELQIAGLHNAANALAALALCRAIDIDFEPLLVVLRRFKGLPHRVEWVAEIANVAFYDDSKGTNVGATCAALAGLNAASDKKVVLIAGGDGKGQDFSPLRAPVKNKARAVVLIGRDSELIAAALAGIPVPQIQASSMEDAVKKAFVAAQIGDAVLLSPACASFDMFRNYVHRAEVFIAAVKDLSMRQAQMEGV